ncbi:ComF family protein [Paenibacillus sp. LHD-117]|uniref:ComF family protein n=1 Tax=Paenibacillus sp. LHD-117 TaxID=3071412 RepID=UPI0027E09CB6|nr:ComF family protein [Paenibacillus sp. LHD-117]MDQ6422510.1 ComF family protein [Paenibacillus sp. LHD-117]
MSELVLKWLESVKRSFTGINHPAEWLSPQADGCAACGKAIRFDTPSSSSSSSFGGLPVLLQRSLCIRCSQSIPWLSRVRCAKCGRAIHCEDCVRNPERAFQLNRSAVEYDSVMRSWLALYKYRGKERMGPILAEMLIPPYERLTAAIGGRWDAITYVPISEERAMERGFNQAEAMAGHLAGRFGLPLLPLLRRERHAEKMSFKTRTQRIRDVQTLFAPSHEGFRVLHARIHAAGQAPATAINLLLVDDIYTTGSTAGACAAVLKEASRSFGAEAHVYVLTWARS